VGLAASRPFLKGSSPCATPGEEIDRVNIQNIEYIIDRENKNKKKELTR
jgi:hypothetical protein